MWEIEADHLDFFGSLKFFWVWGIVTFRLWETLSNYFSVQSNVGKVKQKNFAPICTLVQSAVKLNNIHTVMNYHCAHLIFHFKRLLRMIVIYHKHKSIHIVFGVLNHF